MLLRLCLTALTTVAVSVATAGAAHAGIGTTGDGDGFSIAVNASVDGEDAGLVTGGGGGGITLHVPPKCYWETIPADYDLSGSFDAGNPEDFEKFYEEMIVQMRGHAAAGYFSFPSREYVKGIVKAEKSGKADYSWYVLRNQEGVNCADEGFTGSSGTVGDAYGAEGAGDAVNDAIPTAYQAFEAGQPPPPPLVDVGELAEEVWDYAAQNIDDPNVDRNPKIASTGNATLVNLPTWFWVTNTAEALAHDGRVDLEVSIPGTPVQMSLHAQTDEVTVTSPAGAKTCSIDEIKNSYDQGESDGGACTLEFSRSNSGWPVTTTTNWTGSWEGVDNNGPQNGTIAVVGHSSTVDVPVNESQAVVDSVG